MATTVDWVLVADRSRARIFKTPTDQKGHFPLHATFAHEEGRLQRHEMESDSPGRVYRQGGSRSGVDPHEDPEHRESRKFAAELSVYLDKACQEHQFDRLIVVAPPTFLGILRDHWTVPVQACIAHEIHKELAGLSDSHVQTRLADILTEVPA